MRHLGKLLLAGLVLVALAKDLSADDKKKANSSTQATIARVKGEAEVRSKSGAPWQPAREGAKIALGGEVHTGIRSEVELRFEDGSTVQVDSLSQVKLQEAHQEGGELAVDLRLGIGRVNADVAKGRRHGRFKVSTPSVTAAVRGTSFDVDCSYHRDPRPDVFVNVAEGEVACAQFEGGERAVFGGELCDQFLSDPVALMKEMMTSHMQQQMSPEMTEVMTNEMKQAMLDSMTASNPLVSYDHSKQGYSYFEGYHDSFGDHSNFHFIVSDSGTVVIAPDFQNTIPTFEEFRATCPGTEAECKLLYEQKLAGSKEATTTPLK